MRSFPRVAASSGGESLSAVSSFCPSVTSVIERSQKSSEHCFLFRRNFNSDATCKRISFAKCDKRQSHDLWFSGNVLITARGAVRLPSIYGYLEMIFFPETGKSCQKCQKCLLLHQWANRQHANCNGYLWKNRSALVALPFVGMIHRMRSTGLWTSLIFLRTS